LNSIDERKYDTTYKIVVMGEPAVGKSALTLRFITENFVKDYNPTIEDSYRKPVTLDAKCDLIEVLDTAGNNDFGAMMENWINEGNAFVLVYAINDLASFQRITAKRERILKVKEKPNVPMILLGNKCDLESERVVSFDEGSKLSQKWGSKFLETSAKEKINVDESFYELIRSLRGQQQAPEKKVVKPKKKSWCKIL